MFARVLSASEIISVRPGYRVCSATEIEEMRFQMGEDRFWNFVSHGGLRKPCVRVRAGREVVA